jgi:RNA polymerase sigma-70 factor (ECF subfamily)
LADSGISRRDLRDPESIRAIYRRHGRGIFNYALRLVGDYQWAEEILQETFLRAFSRAETFREGARVSTWLYRIAMNLCYDHLRSPRNRPKVSLSERVSQDYGGPAGLSDLLEESGGTPDEIASESEVARLVRQCVADLPEKERNVLVLRHYHGMKFREIAGVTGLTTRTVQNCLKRAREKMARSLTRKGVEPEKVT